ncbi:MAG: PAS domain S-box protein [Candidatus Marinimicrobia bacterium]|nr:PAS domain S-box protein [Candidatus Neomarinimicrobiota bacterium]
MNGGGLNLFNEKDSTFLHFRYRGDDPGSISTDYIHTVYEDKRGNLWIGTFGYGLELFDRDNNKFIHYIHNDTIPTTISDNFVNCIYEDSEGRLWVGTTGGLNLMDRENGTFKRITTKDGLPNDVINGILEDDSGNLWISTNNGICKFNYRKFTFTNYNVYDGLQDNFFRVGSYFKLSTGEMLFGGNNGFNIFNPDDIKLNTFVPPVVITRLKVFNKEILPGEDSPINKAITYTKEINLTYKDLLFSLTIASLNHWIPEKNQYAYRLLGKSEKWINLEHGNTITFTNLSPGKYTLQFKASNNDGIWNETGTEVKLKISPPFWKTPIHWTIVGILSTFIILMLIKLRLKNIEKRNKILNEINEKLEQEIKQRKKIEQELRESEEKYRQVVENAPYGIVIHKDGKIIFANKTFLKLSGVENINQVMGRNVMDFVSEESKIIAKKRIQNGYEKLKFAEPIEEKLLRDDGSEYFAEVSAVPLKGPDGGVETHVFIADITEEKKAEEEKKVLAEQLKQSQKLEAIGQLAGGIAHDFNNILTVIIGYTEILLGQELIKNDPSSHKFLITIKESADKAKDLVNQLLAFSRKQLFRPEKINLNNVIHNMENMLRRLISENIELTFLLDQNLPDINADPRQIEQVILNLVVNARDAIFEKENATDKRIIIETGTSSIDAKYKAIDPEVKEGDYVYISVSDTGIGMTKEIKKRIFDPFFTTKGVGKGTGLGLSTVYGIVKQNDGTVTVYSEPGKGSTFKVYWPIIKEDAKSTKDKGSQFIDQELPKGNETILFVEDEQDIKDMMIQTLQTLGYKVYTAANGYEAVSILELNNGKFDLLITDIIMPGMSGKELADLVVKNYPNIKLLFTSGYTDDYIVNTGIIDKDVNFINKPYSLKDMAFKIREILDKK